MGCGTSNEALPPPLVSEGGNDVNHTNIKTNNNGGNSSNSNNVSNDKHTHSFAEGIMPKDPTSSSSASPMVTGDKHNDRYNNTKEHHHRAGEGSDGASHGSSQSRSRSRSRGGSQSHRNSRENSTNRTSKQRGNHEHGNESGQRRRHSSHSAHDASTGQRKHTRRSQTEHHQDGQSSGRLPAAVRRAQTQLPASPSVDAARRSAMRSRQYTEDIAKKPDPSLAQLFGQAKFLEKERRKKAQRQRTRAANVERILSDRFQNKEKKGASSKSKTSAPSSALPSPVPPTSSRKISSQPKSAPAAASSSSFSSEMQERK